MNALVIHKYGTPENFVYENVNKAKIVKSTHVLIKVLAIGCNTGEILLTSGKASTFMPLKFPSIVGLDFSGVIEEIGSDVVNLSVGQEVHGQFRSPNNNGAYAEYVVVDQKYDVIVPKPSCISHAEAAALGTAGATAYAGLVDECKIKQGDGQRILIIGAAGGIGSYAVAMAKALGANVTGICSTKNVEIVQNLGADKVIDYKSNNFLTELKSCPAFDCVLDTVGGDDYYFLIEPLLKRGGIYSSAVLGPVVHGFGDDFSLPKIIRSLIVSKWRNLVGGTYYKVISILNADNTPFYQRIDSWYESGLMKSPPIETAPLKDGASALCRLEKHQIVGKLVLIP